MADGGARGDTDTTGSDAGNVAGAGGSEPDTEPGDVEFAVCDGVDPQVWFVDCGQDEGAAGDGSSWDAALAHPSQAAAQAATCDEIWIREGTCLPLGETETIVSPQIPLRIFGGFEGMESSPTERAGALTVFDGDLAGDDAPGDADSLSDNARHLVVVDGSEAGDIGVSVQLDGLVLRAGNAAAPDATTSTAFEPGLTGGGVLVTGGAYLLVNDVSFEDNVAVFGGAVAIIGAQSSASILNAEFTGNVARLSGAGVHVEGASVEVQGSTFFGGDAPYGGAIGGNGGNGFISESTFQRNRGQGGGGALRFEGGSYEVDSSVFVGNSCPTGGAIAMLGGDLTLSRSIVAANTAVGQGGGVYAERAGGELSVRQTAIVGNQVPDSNGGGVCFYGDVLDIDGSSIVGNQAGYGAGVRSEGQLSLRNSEVRQNRASDVAGGLMVDNGGSIIVNAVLSRNWGQTTASAAVLNFETVNTWVHVNLTENRRGGWAADAVALVNGANLTLENSLLYSDGSDDSGLLTLDGAGTYSGSYNCSVDVANGGTPLTQLTSNPFSGDPAQGDFLQRADSPCLDAGSDEVANGFELAWTSLTAVQGEATDSEPVDAGYHYAPGEVRIGSLNVDLIDATWTTTNAARCVLGNSASDSLIAIDAAALNEGTLEHGAAPQDGVFLICWDEAERPKASWVVAQ
jgi:hypothetical protein